ncbi:MAG: hypothetical protein JW806_10675, partial [Sedimentisphaerales bacterium]|nr:hypothetical protein [Sedimentisphaerales bacterium]
MSKQMKLILFALIALILVPSAAPAAVIQENETGFCNVDGAIESEHSGYTGSGYSNTDNSNGTGIDYKANVNTAGTYSVAVRFANGSSSRSADLIVNGLTIEAFSFAGTGTWTT